MSKDLKFSTQKAYLASLKKGGHITPTAGQGKPKKLAYPKKMAFK